MQQVGLAIDKSATDDVSAKYDRAKGVSKATALAICTGGDISQAYAEAWEKYTEAKFSDVGPIVGGRGDAGCQFLPNVKASALEKCQAAAATNLAANKVWTQVFDTCGIPLGADVAKPPEGGTPNTTASGDMGVPVTTESATPNTTSLGDMGGNVSMTGS